MSLEIVKINSTMNRRRKKKEAKKDALRNKGPRKVDSTRGSDLWAISYLKENMLTALLNDLYNLRKKGLRDEYCQHIQDFLEGYVNSTLSVPKGDWNGSPISDVARRFAKVYEEWNDIDGETEDAEKRRNKLYKKLQDLRQDLANADRNLRYELYKGVKPEPLRAGYQSVRDVISLVPDTFMYLSSAFNDYVKRGGSI